MFEEKEAAAGVILTILVAVAIISNLVLMVWRSIKEHTELLLALKITVILQDFGHIGLGIGLIIVLASNDATNKDSCTGGGYLVLFSFTSMTIMSVTEIVIMILWQLGKITVGGIFTCVVIAILVVEWTVTGIVTFFPLAAPDMFDSHVVEFKYVCIPIRLPGEKNWGYSFFQLFLIWLAFVGTVAIVVYIFVRSHPAKFGLRSDQNMDSTFYNNWTSIKELILWLMVDLVWNFVLLCLLSSAFFGISTTNQNSRNWGMGYVATFGLVIHALVPLISRLRSAGKIKIPLKMLGKTDIVYKDVSIPANIQDRHILPNRTKDGILSVQVKWDVDGKSISGVMKLFPVSMKQRWKNEVKAIDLLIKMPHQNIAEYFWSSRINRYMAMLGSQSGISQNSRVICRAYMEHGSLREVLYSRRNTLTEGSLHMLAVDIAKGLSHLHSIKLVHNRISAKSIYLTGSSQNMLLKAVLADFEDSRIVHIPKLKVYNSANDNTGVLAEASDISELEIIRDSYFTADIRAYGLVILEMIMSLFYYRIGTKTSDINQNVSLIGTAAPPPESFTIVSSLSSRSNSSSLSNVHLPRLKQKHSSISSQLSDSDQTGVTIIHSTPLSLSSQTGRPDLLRNEAKSKLSCELQQIERCDIDENISKKPIYNFDETNDDLLADLEVAQIEEDAKLAEESAKGRLKCKPIQASIAHVHKKPVAQVQNDDALVTKQKQSSKPTMVNDTARISNTTHYLNPKSQLSHYSRSTNGVKKYPSKGASPETIQSENITKVLTRQQNDCSTVDIHHLHAVKSASKLQRIDYREKSMYEDRILREPELTVEDPRPTTAERNRTGTVSRLNNYGTQILNDYDDVPTEIMIQSILEETEEQKTPPSPVVKHFATEDSVESRYENMQDSRSTDRNQNTNPTLERLGPGVDGDAMLFEQEMAKMDKFPAEKVGKPLYTEYQNKKQTSRVGTSMWDLPGELDTSNEHEASVKNAWGSTDTEYDGPIDQKMIQRQKNIAFTKTIRERYPNQQKSLRDRIMGNHSRNRVKPFRPQAGRSNPIRSTYPNKSRTLAQSCQNLTLDPKHIRNHPGNFSMDSSISRAIATSDLRRDAVNSKSLAAQNSRSNSQESSICEEPEKEVEAMKQETSYNKSNSSTVSQNNRDIPDTKALDQILQDTSYLSEDSGCVHDSSNNTSPVTSKNSAAGIRSGINGVSTTTLHSKNRGIAPVRRPTPLSETEEDALLQAMGIFPETAGQHAVSVTLKTEETRYMKQDRSIERHKVSLNGLNNFTECTSSMDAGARPGVSVIHRVNSGKNIYGKLSYRTEKTDKILKAVGVASDTVTRCVQYLAINHERLRVFGLKPAIRNLSHSRSPLCSTGSSSRSPKQDIQNKTDCRVTWTSDGNESPSSVSLNRHRATGNSELHSSLARIVANNKSSGQKGINSHHIQYCREISTMFPKVNFDSMVRGEVDKMIAFIQSMKQTGKIGIIANHMLNLMRVCWFMDNPPTAQEIQLRLLQSVPTSNV